MKRRMILEAMRLMLVVSLVVSLVMGVLVVGGGRSAVAQTGADDDGGRSSELVELSDGTIVALEPARLLDTRIGDKHTTIDGQFRGEGRVAADEAIRVQITGRGGVPAGALAAVINVTLIEPSTSAFATVYPCSDRPWASSLNAPAGGVVPNELIAKLSDTGEVCVYTNAEADFVIDVTGFIPADSTTALVPLEPARLLDTRIGDKHTTIDGQFRGEGRVAADEAKRVQITGRGGVPAGALAAVINVTLIEPSTSAFATVYPCSDRPWASSLNAPAGGTKPNELIAKLSDTGEVCVYTNAEADFVIDVTGFIPADSTTALVSLEPARLLDTRIGDKHTTIDGQFRGEGRVAADEAKRVQITGRGGVPAGALAAVINVTVVEPSAATYVTVYPCGDLPWASSLNAITGATVPNEIIAELTGAGEMCLYTISESDFVIDVTGYIPATPTELPTVGGAVVPDVVVPEQGDAVVPDVVGLQQGDAMTRIDAASLRAASDGAIHDPAPAGQVLSQSPPPGTGVDINSPVPFVVSLGPELAPIPDVLGLDEGAAAAAITGAGFVVGEIGAAESDVYNINEVNNQLPHGGQQALPGTPVDLTITTGTVNDPPEITTSPTTTHTAGTDYTYDVDAIDPDGDTLTYTLQAGPADDTGNPLAAIDTTTGVLTWNPTIANTGPHDFAIHVSDGRNGTDVQSFTLDITNPNRTPNAVDDSYIVARGQSLPIPAASLVGNDTDPDADVLAVTAYTQPQSGRLTGDTTELIYTPNDPESASTIAIDVELTETQPVTITSDHSSQSRYPLERLNDASTAADWFTAPTTRTPLTLSFAFDTDVALRRVDLFGSRQFGERGYEVRRFTVRALDAAGTEVFTDEVVADPDPNIGDGADADTSFDLLPANGGEPISGVRTVEVVITEAGARLYPGLSEIDLYGDAPVVFLAPQLEWADLEEPAQTVPLVADLDADGVPEVVYNTVSGELRARRGDSGAEVWTRPASGPGEAGAEQYGTPVIADFSDEPGLEVVHPASDSRTLQLVDATGVVRDELATGLNFAEGNLAAADVDGDGQPEIIGGGGYSDRLGVYDINRDTSELSVRWESAASWGCGRNFGWPYCTPVVVDIDLDGRPEIVTGKRVSDAATGASEAVTAGGEIGFVGVANFDDDPEGEIVRISNGTLTILNHNMSTLWGPVNLATRDGSTSRGRGGPPTIADFDGDGKPEIGVAGAEVYAVYDPAADDVVLWKSEINDTSSSSTGSTLFDFDNDGRAEVVYADQDFIRVYDGPTGSIRWEAPNGSGTRSEAPVVADVDGDGQAEIVVTSERPATHLGTRYPAGVRVYGSPANNWVRARAIWNQHQYNVVNVNSDGTVPAVAEINWLRSGLNNFRQQAFLSDDVDRLDRFTYTATDPGGASDTATVFVDIVAPENAPEVTCGPPAQATVGFEFTGRVCADDIDGDALAISAEITPTTPGAGFTIDADTGTFDWLPTTGGDFEVVVLVTDATGRQARRTYPVRVVAPAQVPDVVGVDRADAELTVTDADLRSGTMTEVSDPAVPIGIVISQTPPGGAVAEPQSRVDLVISSGPAPADLDADSDTFSTNQGDCDDTDPAIHPNAAEVDNDGVDSDCDGVDGGLDVAAVSISGADSDLALGRSRSFTAQALLADGRVVDITELATFGSTDDTVATVSGRTATAVAAGPFGITASFSGLTATETLTAIISTPADETPPVAEITAPVGGGELSAEVDIVGSASDDNLLGWTLSAVAEDGSRLAEIAAGTDPVVDGVLGTLGTATVPAGVVTLRLEVEDSGGNLSRTDVPVIVLAGPQPGQFSLSFTDLTVPVSGLPISVIRTYDSRDRRPGDFGAAWDLDLTGLDIRVGPDQGIGWKTVPGRFGSSALQPTAEHSVVLTLPDGGQEIFDLVPSPRSALFTPLSFTTATYSSRRGTSGTLVPTGNANLLVLQGAAGVELVDDTTLNAYNPPGFVYTRLDGTAFTLDADGTLTRIADPAGNVITVDDAGITHSAGASVAFERDSLGRIAAVTDPEGNKVTYRYSAAGDLVAHTDREGNTTTYVYEDGHYLTEVRDPLGRRAARMEYDDQGRLIATVDAEGRRVVIDHDVAARTETVTNPGGTTRSVQYDDNGNIVSETDEAGRTTARTFDGFNNLLSETDPLGNTTSFTYDDNGNETSRTDSSGDTTVYDYDERGRVASVTDPLGNVTSFVRDSAGRVLERRLADGAVEQFSYDSAGNLVSTTDPRGATTTMTRDANGNIASLVDASGTEVTAAYNQNGAPTTVAINGETSTLTTDAESRLTKLVDANGATSTVVYDAAGDVASITDALGNTTRRTYHPDGQLAEVTQADGTTMSWTYDLRGQLESATGADGSVVGYAYAPDGQGQAITLPDATPGDLSDNPQQAFTFDGAGRVNGIGMPSGATPELGFDVDGHVASLTDALGAQRVTLYDGADRVIEEVDRLGRSTTFDYDERGHVTRVTRPDGTEISMAYDPGGNRTSEQDPVGRVVNSTYDELNRLTSITDHAGNPTSYTYTAVGDLASVTDASGSTTRYRYGATGLLIGVVNQNGSEETIDRDAAGRPVSHVDVDGTNTTFTYNEVGQLVGLQVGSGATTFSFDDAGRLISTDDGGNVTTRTYNARGLLKSQTEPDGRVTTYGYDIDGRVISTETPGGTTAYLRDDAGRIVSVTDVTGTTTFAYDAVGNIERLDLANGAVERRTYDSMNRPTSQIVTSGANTAVSLSYSYGADGRIQRQVDAVTGVTTDYVYDESGRPVQETRSGPDARVITYDYDAVGNRIRTVDSVDGETTLAYDAAHRLLTRIDSSGTTSFNYDAAGRMLASIGPDGTTLLGWTDDGRLSIVSQTPTAGPATVTNYRYDADGLLVATDVDGVETRYLYDRSQRLPVLLESSQIDGTVTGRATVGPELISWTEGTASRFIHGDVRGSVRALTDADGTLVGSRTYSMDGEITTETGVTTPFGYTGEPHENGRVFLRQRWMMPSTTRMLSPDPFAGIQAQPDSFNPYAYAYGDPVNLEDPSGLNPSLAQQLVVNFMIASMISAVFTGAVGKMIGGSTVTWSGDTYELGFEFGAFDVGFALHLLAAEKEGRRTEGRFLIFKTGMSVDPTEKYQANPDLLRGKDGGWNYTQPSSIAFALISVGLEALRFGPIDFAMGDTNVAAPSLWGRPKGLDPAAISGPYADAGASINLGSGLGAVLRSLGVENNEFGLNFFIQGFGLGGSFIDLLDSGFSTSGASASSGISGGFAFGITPPSKKYMRVP